MEDTTVEKPAASGENVNTEDTTIHSGEATAKQSGDTSRQAGDTSGQGKDALVWKDRKHFMWFPFSFTKYQIKKERLYIDTGIFYSKSDELLLYRIIDIALIRTLGQKIFGTGTITLTTRADSDPVIHLVNIKNSIQVKEMLSDLIEEARDKKRVVGKELYSGHPGGSRNIGPDMRDICEDPDID